MANTLGFVRLSSVSGGRGPVMAFGTAASIADSGSFAVQISSAGSQYLRNILAVELTVLGTAIGGGSLIVQGYGSSDGYVRVNVTGLGSYAGGPTPTIGGTCDLNFTVWGGGGSI